MWPSTKRKNQSKQATCRAVKFVRSGDTGYLGAPKYFSVPTAKSGEVPEGYIQFFRGSCQCAFRKENCLHSKLETKLVEYCVIMDRSY